MIFKTIWKYLCSIRLLITLIIVLVILSVIGIFIMQSPQGISTNSAEYIFWLDNVARPEYGFWTDTMSFLQFFYIFHSVWFFIASGLLVINIITCSINRWNAVKNRIFKGIRSAGDIPDNEVAISLNIGNSSRNAVDTVKKSLSRHGFILNPGQDTGTVQFSAVKNKYSPFGTYLTHLSLILFITGFIVSGYLGFMDESFIVVEGQKRPVGHGTELTLQLQKFTDEYWPDGTPRDYSSDVILLDGNTEVRHADIRVNYPLIYKGIRFHQASFGKAVSVKIEKIDGSLLSERPVALSNIMSADNLDRPQGSFMLDKPLLLIYLVAPAVNENDPFLNPDNLGIEIYDIATGEFLTWDTLVEGEKKEVAGLDFTYLESKMFSDFMVSRDPGAIVIWIAAAIFLAGICAVFYFPRRELLVKIDKAVNPSGKYKISIYQRGKSGIPELKSIEKDLNNPAK